MNFKPADPTARVSLSLKESSRREQEYAKLYVKAKFGIDVSSSDVIEQGFSIYFAQDKDLQKFVEGMSAADKAEVEKRLKKEASVQKASETAILGQPE
jgi:hypothetical protein